MSKPKQLDIDDVGPRRVGPFVRTPFNYDMFAASKAAGLECTEPSKTQQSFKDDCDINVIVRRFGVTGQLPNVAAPVYGDFSQIDDFRSAIHAVMDAEDEFMKLDAKIRERFNNDPQELLEFCADTRNIEEAKKLGLVLDKPKPSDIIPPKSGDVPPA